VSTGVRLSVVLAFATIYIVWGTTYLAIRFSIETIPVFLMAGVRFIVGGALFYQWASGRAAETPNFEHWKSAFIIGGLMVACGIGGVTWTEQFVPSGLTALMIAIVPFWIILMDWLRPGGSPPSGAVVFGLVIGFIGLGLLINPGEIGGVSEIDPRGAGAILFATLCWSTGSIYSRHAPQPRFQPLAVGMQMMCGGLILLIVSLAIGELSQFNMATLSLRSVMAVVYLIGPGSIAYAMYLFLLKASTPAKAATYTYVNPIIALIVGAWLGDEVMSNWTLACSAVIILGVVVTITAKMQVK
jgi:drug/metabolite transporter (DMT)-like permease|tara:strand:+ start:704 stop:1603 length:900 start_codon:yes stop_codon:yes gene_type:complete